jgi:hypothetical protein
MDKFSAVLWMLDSFFPQCYPTSTKDMLPFSSSNIFTLSLYSSPLIVTLPFWAPSPPAQYPAETILPLFLILL